MKKITNFFNTNFGRVILFITLFIFLLVLEVNYVGLSIRDKIQIGSTLDFSWFSDTIERLRHGYLLGRDFTFTYGPLFQYIYSLPSLIFQVPSYVSVALSPILSFTIIFILLWYLAKNIFKDISEQVSYLLFVFIVLGFLITSGSDTVKALVPIIYSVFLVNTLIKINWLRIFMVSFLPTLVGLYAYNLFFTSFLITVLILLFFIVKNRKNADSYKLLIIIPLIAFFQVCISFLLTHNFDYIRYSWDSIYNYRYVLDIPWAHDRDNILIVFPLLIICMGVHLWKTNKVVAQKKYIFFILIFASLIELDYAISRSDAGHLLWAFYPSILTFFTIVFVLASRIKIFFPIAFILYLLVPFKPTFYNTLTPKNIFIVLQVVHQKPDFFSVFKLPNNYYYSEKEIKNLSEFVSHHRNTVYVYPYDSYILNMNNTTYNSFALGMYTYSNSSVETNAVNKFNKNPPKYIILGIDSKGTLNLDDIPNFTRNPQMAHWMINNYSVEQRTEKHIILVYTPNKKVNENTCQIIRLTILLTKKENFFQKVEDSIKPSVYYLGSARLPYSPATKSYFLFQDIFYSSGVQNLFTSNTKKYMNMPSGYLYGLIITRVDAFTSKKQNKFFTKNEYSLQCLSLK